jgi:hypothetical protein
MGFVKVFVNPLTPLNATPDFTPVQRTCEDINSVVKTFIISKQLKGTPDILN